MNALKSQLQTALQGINQESLLEPLFEYLMLLDKWNKAYNLTAVRHPEAMIPRHLIDSLAIMPWLQGAQVIDVGTGPGLPGIPLAIARPDVQFVLLDSNGKKTRFLQQVKRQLDLKNIEIVQSRVENYRPSSGFDTIVSRAFSSLEQMLFWTQHLIQPNGMWLAMKGRYPEDELQAIDKPCRVEPYTYQGADGERCCVLIQNK